MQIPMDWRKVSVVFLDMDGTLLDLNFDNYFWHEYVPLRFSQKHNINLDQAKQNLQSRYKSKAGTLDWYCTDYWTKELDLEIALLKQEISHRIQIFPKVKQFLGRLKKINKRVLLVTNAHRDSITIKMDFLQLESYFDKIISSHDYGYPKEDISFWDKLMEYEPYEPERTLFIDDNIDVLSAAKESGIQYLISIKQPDSSKPEQDTLHYKAISNFAQIMPS